MSYGSSLYTGEPRDDLVALQDQECVSDLPPARRLKVYGLAILHDDADDGRVVLLHGTYVCRANSPVTR